MLLYIQYAHYSLMQNTQTYKQTYVICILLYREENNGIQLNINIEFCSPTVPKATGFEYYYTAGERNSLLYHSTQSEDPGPVYRQTGHGRHHIY